MFIVKDIKYLQQKRTWNIPMDQLSSIFNPKAKVTRETLEDVTSTILDIVLKKNHDYGDSWQKTGLAGIFVRLSDKCTRIETIAGREVLVVDEAAIDTLMDIAGYAILGLLHARASGEF